MVRRRAAASATAVADETISIDWSFVVDFPEASDSWLRAARAAKAPEEFQAMLAAPLDNDAIHGLALNRAAVLMEWAEAITGFNVPEDAFITVLKETGKPVPATWPASLLFRSSADPAKERTAQSISAFGEMDVLKRPLWQAPASQG